MMTTSNEILVFMETSPTVAVAMFTMLLTQMLKDSLENRWSKFMPLVSIVIAPILYVPIMMFKQPELPIYLTIVQGLFVGMGTTGAYKAYQSVPKNKK